MMNHFSNKQNNLGINRADQNRWSYHESLIRQIVEGAIKDRKSLQVAKIALARQFNLSEIPPNSETLAVAGEDEYPLVLRLLRRKPTRTLSGVAVVAVMTSPAPCPHGKCIYCPGGVEYGSPQSYTGKEPAARRASANDFDAFRQVRSRISQLEAIGHPTDKIDLIIMGGTFTTRPRDYQVAFVKGCFDALNSKKSDSLEEAHEINETADHRCIGMTVETRPDSFDREKAEFSMYLGATRVEFGVQILHDEILSTVKRGHGVSEVVKATRIAKELGLKVCYHIMPGLPGSTREKDIASFSMMFEDERFRPDMLKIYPTLVVKGTPLYDLWKDGKYKPYSTEEAVEVIAQMKKIVPPYVRIQRIQRDIPVPLIEAGVDKGHLRELVKEKMKKDGASCRCIRCREVGLLGVEINERLHADLEIIKYRASGGDEYFISFEIPDRNALIGYARLRINDSPLNKFASLRELKVFGQMLPVGRSGESWQHRGFGRQLIAEAERIARDRGCEEIKVTSGVGVRRYYSSLGYMRDGVYMTKKL